MNALFINKIFFDKVIYLIIWIIVNYNVSMVCMFVSECYCSKMRLVNDYIFFFLMNHLF